MVDLGHNRRQWPQQGGAQLRFSKPAIDGPGRLGAARRIRDMADLVVGCGVLQSCGVRCAGRG